MAEIDELQQRTTGFLKRRDPREAPGPGATARRPFSIFMPDDAARSAALTSRFIEVANSIGGDAGLEAVLDEAEEAAAREGVDIVQHALMVFITHHPDGARLPIISLEEREPEMVAATSRRLSLVEQVDLGDEEAEEAEEEAEEAEEEAEEAEEEAEEEEEADPEARLAWFREDPFMSEHHEHWHLVYPGAGVNGVRKDRQGELFYYMHQQMLARYDTERLAVGLPLTQPLQDYTEEIPEGYDPGPALRNWFAPRPPGQRMIDIALGGGATYTVDEHAQRRDRLLQAVENGSLETSNGAPREITADVLGATAEATIESVSSDGPGRFPSFLSFYGQHHNFGHVLLAALRNPGDRNQGVMASVQAAVRDPVFYRWHRHVDDICYRWQEQQGPQSFDDAPPVRLRNAFTDGQEEGQSPDIILAFRDTIPGASDPAWDGQSWGQETFGGDNWDTNFSESDLTTGELETMMLSRESQGFTIPYLDQREFCYFIRVENLADEEKRVTVRIFLVASQAQDERWMWLEMDKFQHNLGPRERAVIFRPAWASSVIRKPATKPPTPLVRTGNQSEDEYCNCGWPYNLLVPRGTADGMDFRLMVMVTDWELDRVAQDSACGSMSFCGTKDRYPDRRAMGYPFDRPFAAGRSISQTILGQENMAARDIMIRLMR
jgi:tyrosinase